ncbi:MAG: XdhC family protein [Chloroflexi bacterium]|nr:XdhC family protein [Chloroflexota bacterium]
MQPVFDEADKLLKKGEPFVLATVVRTKGSTPQKPGAKLLVRRDGTAVGTLGGGCVEADVWAEAKTIFEQNNGAQLRRFVLNEDIAANDGLVCGGNMDILIDPIMGDRDMAPFVDEILAAYQGRGDRAMATLVTPGKTVHGSLRPASGQAIGSPRTGLPGSKLFVRANGSTVGTLGSEALDRAARNTALEVMPRGLERWVETEDGARAFVETFTNPPTVVIAGGGHVGKAVYNFAKMLGYKVWIVDDREVYANKERFPDADRIVVDEFDKGLRSLDLSPNCFVIIATRGHKLDDIATREAARSKAGYIGLLGSRRKSLMIFRDLIREGVPEERIREIRAPVGLDIGGRTPDEIAISIMAEIIAVRHDKQGGSMTMDAKFVDKARQMAAKPRPKSRAIARL